MKYASYWGLSKSHIPTPAQEEIQREFRIVSPHEPNLENIDGSINVEANAVRLAVDASGTYLNAISLLIVLCDLRNSIEDDEDKDMIFKTANSKLSRRKKNCWQ